MDEQVRQWRTVARGLSRNPDLTPKQVRSLRQDIQLLCKQRTRWLRSSTEEIPVSRGVTVVRRKSRLKYGGRLRGKAWSTDPRSSGPCPLCYKELPHRDYPARVYHCHMRNKVRGLRQAWARMRAGTFRPWEISSANARAKAHARRLAFFLERVSPHVTGVLGRAAVDAIVWAYGTNYDYPQYAMWIRNRYGEGRKKVDKARRTRLASA